MSSGRRSLLCFAGAAALGALWSRPAAAAKVWRVGILDLGPRESKNAIAERFVKAMQDLGYAEGRHIHYVYRYPEAGGPDWRTRFPALAQELVRTRPDAIVTAGTVATKALQRATTTIPIVTNAGDPVGAGFAKSLVRPGGNITGVALASPEIYRKGFEHLKTIIPGDWTLAIAYEEKSRDFLPIISAVEAGARACAIPVRTMSFKGMDARQVDRALASMRGQGIRVLSAFDHIAGIPDEGYDLLMARKYGLATAPSSEDDVAKGALMSYDPLGEDMDERKAFQLTRILRGTPAGEIPFDTPTRYRLLINRKPARILGLTIPPEILTLADQVYE